MKIIIISKSDARGGAAVVSKRLMEALRRRGVDARMLVAEKMTDSEYVSEINDRRGLKRSFLKERLRIFLGNVFSRRRLFQVDVASDGLPLSEHPLVKGADVVVLGWVNQGMISLEEIGRIRQPVVWVMHDMWNMTGICHHAYDCRNYTGQCGECPCLGFIARRNDLSHRTFRRKMRLYGSKRICFVSVSNWLAGRAAQSALLRDMDVRVVNNPFLPGEEYLGIGISAREDDIQRMVFGAARIDDPVKGFPLLKKALAHLSDHYPELASRMELLTFGDVREQSSLSGISIAHRHLGRVPSGRVSEIYSNADIVVSSSLWETLPGTLVEGQAYGCLPVCFRRGGQPDIVEHRKTGFMAEYNADEEVAAVNLCEGIVWASSEVGGRRDLRKMLQDGVDARFSPDRIADSFIEIFRQCMDECRQ